MSNYRRPLTAMIHEIRNNPGVRKKYLDSITADQIFQELSVVEGESFKITLQMVQDEIKDMGKD